MASELDSSCPTLKVDPEFAAFLPKHTVDEEGRMEANLLRDKEAQDPICVWGDTGIIIDGHRRYAKALKLKLPYLVRRIIGLADRHAVLVWMLHRQNGRRNMTADQKAAIRIAAGDDAKKQGRPTESTKDAPTLAEVAKEAGTNEAALKRARRVGKKGSAALKSAVIDGKIGLADAVKVVSLPEVEQNAALEKVEAGESATLMQAAKSLRQKLEEDAEGEQIAEETVEQAIDRVNKSIEKFCSGLMAYVKANLPDDNWLEHQDTVGSAVRKFKDGCSTLRLAKCHAECPMCEGGGCDQCIHTGRMPKGVYDQWVSRKK